MFRGNGVQSFWGDGTFLLSGKRDIPGSGRRDTLFSGIQTTYPLGKNPLGIGNFGYEVQPFNAKL